MCLCWGERQSCEDQMDVFVLMGERCLDQSCEDEGDQMDVFVLMGERQSCEDEGD